MTQLFSDQAHPSSVEAEEAAEQLTDLIDEIGSSEFADEFPESVALGATDMREWVETNKRVTEAQLGAIENWKAGWEQFCDRHC